MLLGALELQVRIRWEETLYHAIRVIGIASSLVIGMTARRTSTVTIVACILVLRTSILHGYLYIATPIWVPTYCAMPSGGRARLRI